ncbi:Stp1/IreP family PP2C-type Ser/Thr phosphatase [bacterium D16-50]|nr:Stp1/IreP family PP2C-type Ser/Thr phosphatase [Lachnospiraceae bacterium]RKJ18929.1 Stp1/IreP family PP2C-type Ser/Thr phosphatase [bacterium D16-50]
MLKTFSITDIGRKRKVNQDFVYSSERFVGPLPNLFLVADGMGGHNAGDYASRLAVETIVERSSGSLETNPLRVLDEAVQSANGLVRKRAQETPELQGMGTTVVAAVIDGRELYVANVGDSRLYIVNSGEIRQITKDHSWVEEMVRRGGIGKAEARNHPDKNIITRAVGAEETVRIDFFQVLLQEGDVILMCTDGLTNMLEDEEIRMTLDGARDIVEKAQGLVRAANERGGRDNISVVLIEFI